MRLGDGLLSARLQGAWQDRSLDYDALVQLEERMVQVTFNSAKPERIDIDVDDIDGAVLVDDTLTLHVSTGTPIVLYGSPHLEGFRHRLEAAVCSFPAQTLSLRGFGSERSAPGSDHDRWFEALLTSRRVAEETRTVETQRRAFDADRLSRHAQALRNELAAERHTSPADRRALAAELEELAASFTAALRDLESAATELRHSAHARQFEQWRHWTGLVQRAFRAADDVWTLMVPVLCDSRGAKGTLWRRILSGRSSRGGA